MTDTVAAQQPEVIHLCCCVLEPELRRIEASDASIVAAGAGPLRIVHLGSERANTSVLIGTLLSQQEARNPHGVLWLVLYFLLGTEWVEGRASFFLLPYSLRI
jgi:hypothetical protein